MTKQTHFKQTHLKKAGHKLRVGTLAVTASFAFTIPLGITAELPHPSPEDTRVPSGTATADKPVETTLGTTEGAAAVRVYRDP